MEQFKSIAEDLFNKTAVIDISITQSLSHAEHTIELDYRGRYLFELLQNARDAAKAVNEDANVKIILKEDRLLILNSGQPFTETGLRGICRIGLSTKPPTTGYIGNKGLGFKSVLEISDKPRIVTQLGTIYFDRELARQQLNAPALSAKDIPLLFFPMYDPETISAYDNSGKYSTLIILPFRANVNPNVVIRDIEQIKPHFFPLLGHFKCLEIIDETRPDRHTTYQIDYPRQGYCEVIKNGIPTLGLQLFEHKFNLTEEQFNQLPDDEKDKVKIDVPIDIKIGLQFKNGSFQPAEDTPLYLFYPLEEKSGFRFIIHSHFVVTPNRKSLLLNSALNRIILDQLKIFIEGEFLSGIKKQFRQMVPEIMAFLEKGDSSLLKYAFYQGLKTSLKETPLIWNDDAGRFLNTTDFRLLTPEQKIVFTEPKLGDHYLLYYPVTSTVYKWLTGSLRTTVLGKEQIIQHIEEYSENQRVLKKWNYFNHLYSFIEKANIHLRHKRILLTEHSLLLDSTSEVYYGGQKTDIKLPPQLEKALTFMHPAIKLNNIRSADKYTGAEEFSTDKLTTRAFKMFESTPDLRPGLLLLLRDLLFDKPYDKIPVTICVPISGEMEWKNPFFEPVYWPVPSLSEIYPNACFVDVEQLKSLDPDLDKWNRFLLKCNVWESPAVYIIEKHIISNPNHIKLITPGNTTALEIQNDYQLDIPPQITPEYYELLFKNWNNYSIALQLNRRQISWNRRQLDPVKHSSFIFNLKTDKWIFINNNRQKAWKPSDIFVLPIQDENQNQFRVLKKYFSILFASDVNNVLFQHLGMTQLRNLDMQTASDLFKIVQEQFPDPPQEADFASAINRLYSFLFEFYRKRESDRQIIYRNLKNIYLLAEKQVNNKKEWSWQLGSTILYIDDKPLFDKLPNNVKMALPPHFTKRDRNEIGVIMNNVGIVISKIIHKELAPYNTHKECKLFDHLNWLHYALALFEHTLSIQLDFNQLQTLQNTDIAFVYDLKHKVKVTTGIAEDFQQDIHYFIEKLENGNYKLLFKSNNTTSTYFVQAVHEFFENFLDRELNLIFLFQELEKGEAHAFNLLNDLNVDHVRITELKEHFDSKPRTIRTIFWNAITTNINYQEIIEDDLQIDQLLHNIAILKPLVTFQTLKALDAQLDTGWTIDTLQTIQKLCLDYGINSEHIIEHLGGRVDVGIINKRILEVSLQQHKRSFVSFLYQELKVQDESARKHFLKWVTEYTNLSTIGFNTFSFNPEDILARHRNDIATRATNKAYSDPVTLLSYQDEMALYREHLKQLKQKLDENNVGKNHLENFLESMEAKSLLCFDVDHSFNQYVSFNNVIKNQISNSNGTGNEASGDNPEINNAEIEYRSPQKTDAPPPAGNQGQHGTKGNKGGKRPPQSHLDEIGRKGEFYVFMKLKEKYPTTEWVSENAVKSNHAITGDDNLGYDIRYTHNGVTNYIEVKSTSGIQKQFNISIPEVITGLNHSDNYYLYFVTNALEKELTKATCLGPIFKDCKTVDDFMHSELFNVQLSNFSVTFTDAASQHSPMSTNSTEP